MSGGTVLETISYAYNADGQLTSAASPDSAYAYAYDGEGRTTSIAKRGAGQRLETRAGAFAPRCTTQVAQILSPLTGLSRFRAGLCPGARAPGYTLPPLRG